MAKYTDDFKRRILAMANEGRPVAQLSRDYGPSAATIHNWIRKADRASPDDPADMQALRRRLRDKDEEIAILKKAAAWFARETLAPPTRSSRS